MSKPTQAELRIALEEDRCLRLGLNAYGVPREVADANPPGTVMYPAEGVRKGDSDPYNKIFSMIPRYPEPRYPEPRYPEPRMSSRPWADQGDEDPSEDWWLTNEMTITYYPYAVRVVND